ncbi:MAG: PilZ domain-containing protein [Myxococcota bacterium]
MRNGENRSKGKDAPEEEAPEAVDEVRPLLRKCVGKKVEALITDPLTQRAFVGTFKQVSSTHVTFTMSESMDPAPLDGAVLTASFFFDGSCSAFSSHTFRYQSEGRPTPLLTMDVPEAVSSVVARRLFRIPADVEVPVTVTVTFRGAKMVGELLDISRQGLCMKTGRMSPRATRGVDVDVLLQWDGTPARIQARIASVEGEFLGIGLTEESQKNADYQQIVSQQERVALRRRKEDDEVNERRKLEAAK